MNFSFLKIFSRRLSFKVLHAELSLKDSHLQKALEVSKQINYVLCNLDKFIQGGGGSKAIHRHTVTNKKLLVNDRIKLLLDKDSHFLEFGLLAGMCMDYGNLPRAGVVVGLGKIHGHFCLVLAHDATVKGGTFFPISIIKTIRMQQIASLNKLPCIYVVDSGGAFLPLQAEIFPDKYHGGRTFYNEAILSSMGIPQLAVVGGSSTAGGAYCPTMAEEAIIVRNCGVIFLGGPPLVKAATGEIITEQELGGAMMHCSISGCTDYYAETEEEAFEMCRESILTVNYSKVSVSTNFPDPIYPSEDLLLLSVKDKFDKHDMYIILSRILDGSKFKEFKQKFGSNLITGFGFIHSKIVGVLANCNSLTFQDAQKGCHFIQLCENRNIPLCFLQNSSFSEDVDPTLSFSEIIKDRAKMVVAYSTARIPKISICVKSCFEDDNFTMNGIGFEPNFFFMWPLSYISSTKESVNKLVSTKEIMNRLSKSTDITEYDELFEDKTSSFYHASRMKCDAIISPEKTREVLASCLDILSNPCITEPE